MDRREELCRPGQHIQGLDEVYYHRRREHEQQAGAGDSGVNQQETSENNGQYEPITKGGERKPDFVCDRCVQPIEKKENLMVEHDSRQETHKEQNKGR